VSFTGVATVDRSQPRPPVAHTDASALGVAALGAPVIGGVVVASATGVAGLGAPVAGGVVVASAAGWAGLGAPALAGVASVAGLVWGVAFAAGGVPLFCAGAALGVGCDGFGAVLLSELEPPDPLDGVLEGAAGFGALPLSELEPLSEDDFAAAGFGAGEPLPEPPEGPPATLATVRTATEDDTNPCDIAEETAAVCVQESSVPSIHTEAVTPSSTDTEPARHTRTNTAVSTRTGIGRDAVGTGTGGTTLLRRPPAEATDIITKRSASLRSATGRLSPVAGRLSRPRSSRGSVVAQGDSTWSFRGS
jgi:hypothetical protein